MSKNKVGKGTKGKERKGKERKGRIWVSIFTHTWGKIWLSDQSYQDVAVGLAVGSDIGSPAVLVVNEMLSYISFYRNKSNIDALRRTVLSFYISSDIGLAKKLLILKSVSEISYATLSC